MESQRVKLLIEGYLRGWLDFKYTKRTSRLRENLILYHLENEAYADALSHKLMMDSALIGGQESKTRDMLNALSKTYNLYIGLKLPDVATKDKMEENTKITKDTLVEYKKLLEEIQKSQKDKNA